MVTKNRVAIVTGAAQGIGKRTAELLAERGYSLALSDLRSPSDTVRAVAAHGAEVIEFLGDIADEGVVSGFAAAAYRRVLEVNLVPLFLLAKAFGAIMLSQGSGSIINVSSVAGLVGVSD